MLRRALLLLALSLGSPAPAATLVARDVAYLTSASDAVVHGTVVSVSYTTDASGQRWTETTLLTEAWWKGPGGAAVVLTQLGGVFEDGRVQRLMGDPRLSVGDEVVLFLRRDGERWFSTLLSWSVFEVDAADRIRRHGTDLAVVQRDAKGAWTPTSAAAHPPPPTLAALKAEVRR